MELVSYRCAIEIIIILLTAKFWSRVLPATLQIPTSIFCFVALRSQLYDHSLTNRLYALTWLLKTFSIPAEWMPARYGPLLTYVSSSRIRQGTEMDNQLQMWILNVLRHLLGVKTTIPSWSILRECGINLFSSTGFVPLCVSFISLTKCNSLLLKKEKETHWLKRALIPSSTTKQENEGLVGIWRVARSTRLQSLAVRKMLLFNSVPSGYKFAGILYRLCMELTCKLASPLVVVAQSFELAYRSCAGPLWGVVPDPEINDFHLRQTCSSFKRAPWGRDADRAAVENGRVWASRSMTDNLLVPKSSVPGFFYRLPVFIRTVEQVVIMMTYKMENMCCSDAPIP
eukprot:1148497-Pelagomonas_calceolata.AAC.1